MASVPARSERRAIRAVVMAAWAAVLLGIGIQALILSARTFAGAAPNLTQILSGLAGGVAWSAIVCCGLAVGSTAGQYREHIMGVLGLVAAPLAWAAAKGAQRGVQAMSGAEMDAITTAVLEVGVVKAVEYGLLGYVLGCLEDRAAMRLGAHAATGLVFGLVFGAIILWLEYYNAGGQVSFPRALGLALNELIFPIGCAAVTYGAARLGRAVGQPVPIRPPEFVGG